MKSHFIDIFYQHVDAINMFTEHVEENGFYRHMPFDAQRPYNELPLLPPKQEIETRRVLKACIEARTALEAMRGAERLLPNPGILLHTFALLEAQASSEIENIVTTTDKLFRHAGPLETSADPATKEALRYRRALHHGLEMLREKPLVTQTAISICSLIKGVDMTIRATPGTALLNEASETVVYTPPEGADHLRNLLSNWEHYLHEAVDIDPLIRMAVMHYQFEAIHPFTDGNGRTGRILNLLFLVEKGLLDTPILYLSHGILSTRSDYYRLLLQVTTEGAWEEWILYMLNTVRGVAQQTTAKIEAIRSLLSETIETIRQKAPRIYSRELADVIFIKPYCRIGDLTEARIAQRQSASFYLKTLVELRILHEIQSGREKLFFNARLLHVLAGGKLSRN